MLRLFVVPAAVALLSLAMSVGCGRSVPDMGDDVTTRTGGSGGSGTGGAGSGTGGAGSGGTGGTGGAGSGGTGGNGPPPQRCGDSVRQGGEECDLMDLGGQSCGSLGFGDGSLRCFDDCRFDVGGCRMRPPVDECSMLPVSSLTRRCLRDLCECDPETFRRCDDTCLGLLECVMDECDGSSRDLNCIINNCSEFLSGASTAVSLTQCQPDPMALCGAQPSTCGDGVARGVEQCDGADLAGESCRSLGLGDGTLRCSRSCTYNTASCRNNAACGDGVIDPMEDCDGGRLQGLGCRDFGFAAGTLACDASCGYDTSGCHTCGDLRIQAGEECDGSNLGGLSCQRLGFGGGALGCSSSCDLDTSRCAVCGNGVIEQGENCDGTALGGRSCESLGLGTGPLSCHPASCLLDASACSTDPGPACGNGIAEPGELCDGADLTGLGCTDLGFTRGTLACNGQTCRFDTADCRFGSPEPGQSCAQCRQDSCADITEACTSDMACIGGLSCLQANCGTMPDLNCALSCFGSPNSGLTAITMFACIVTQCGDSCIGEL